MADVLDVVFGGDVDECHFARRAERDVLRVLTHVAQAAGERKTALADNERRMTEGRRARAMGIASLRKILAPHPFDVAEARGRTVAVDANNLLWTFVTAMGARGAPPVGPDGRPNAHFIGLVNRLRLYAKWGLRSAWVFDGKPPALKQATLDGRTARIEATGSIELLEDQIEETKHLLTCLGVPWMVAPCESDPQCAQFVRSGVAWAAVTQDYDAALHASPRTLRNLSGSVKRTPEVMMLQAALERARVSREQLVDVAILIGTDYHPGVPGVGPVKALSLVRRHGDLHGVLAAMKVTMPEADEVRALFLDHPVDRDARIDFALPRGDAVEALLHERGLSTQRAAAVCEALSALHA